MDLINKQFKDACDDILSVTNHEYRNNGCLYFHTISNFDDLVELNLEQLIELRDLIGEHVEHYKNKK